MRHIIKLPNEAKLWFIANCLQCETQIPFESEETRRLWTYDHESREQHAVKFWLELEFEGPDPL